MKNLALLVSLILSTIFVWSVDPVPYSGKISIRGVNYDGDAGYIFFAIKDGKTRWRNGNKKDDSIKVLVRNGFYNVLLGRQGMNPYPRNYFWTMMNFI